VRTDKVEREKDER